MKFILMKMDVAVTFLRFVTVVLGIVAAVMTMSYVSSFQFIVHCPGKNDHGVSSHINFPFRVSSDRRVYNVCEGAQVPLVLSGDFSTQSMFYVVVAILAASYATLAFLIDICVYFLDDPLYCSKFYKRLMYIIDITSNTILSILWITGTIIWALGLVELKRAMSFEHIKTINTSMCQKYTCKPGTEPTYTMLEFSTTAGFLSCILWIVNLCLIVQRFRHKDFI
ncbi:unnamed protein product [Meganyctiphanes norvegica]|uniref:MARVEL domain-containing protein n=1 Tax=Meganyctiphanes norvegica TaxID=48144 RepID=A0AAV2Q185_MEGNR